MFQRFRENYGIALRFQCILYEVQNLFGGKYSRWYPHSQKIINSRQDKRSSSEQTYSTTKHSHMRAHNLTPNIPTRTRTRMSQFLFISELVTSNRNCSLPCVDTLNLWPDVSGCNISGRQVGEVGGGGDGWDSKQELKNFNITSTNDFKQVRNGKLCSLLWCSPTRLCRLRPSCSNTQLQPCMCLTHSVKCLLKIKEVVDEISKCLHVQKSITVIDRNWERIHWFQHTRNRKTNE